MRSDHVPVERALRLPRAYRHVPGYLAAVDPQLRIRRSAERPHLFVLERRCRRRSAVQATGMVSGSDLHLQARDGYIHVSTVHPQWLERPWNIVEALTTEGVDLFAKGAQAITDELDYEERWMRESRRRRRRQHFRDIAREGYDLLSRTGNRDGTERTRLNNPGLAPAQA